MSLSPPPPPSLSATEWWTCSVVQINVDMFFNCGWRGTDFWCEWVREMFGFKSLCVFTDKNSDTNIFAEKYWKFSNADDPLGHINTYINTVRPYRNKKKRKCNSVMLNVRSLKKNSPIFGLQTTLFNLIWFLKENVWRISPPFPPSPFPFVKSFLLTKCWKDN